MAKKTGRVPATKHKPLIPEPSAIATSPPRKRLSWREERFINAYVENGGNATRAYLRAYPGVMVSTAGTEGHKLLKEPEISEAIEMERERLKEAATFTREKAVRILAAMAGTTPAELIAIMRTPYEEESYAGAGDAALAAQVTKTPDGYNVATPSMSDRRAALNDLREILGLDKESNRGNWLDGIGDISSVVRAIKGSK